MHRGPVTIADLASGGKLLEIGCLACSRHVFLKPAILGLPGSLPVPKAASRLACSSCGAINQETWHPIWARPDARVSGVTGRY
jgi:hypothetical protein